MKKFLAYTFIELLITLVLISIFLMFAVPAWQSLLAKNRMVIHLNQLSNAILLARSEASKRGMIVTLCKSLDRRTCSGDWSDGQLVFIDRKGNGQVQMPEDIIRVFDALPPGTTLDWQGARSSKDYLQVIPYGVTEVQNGSFLYCPANKDPRYIRMLIVSPTGRVRVVEKTSCYR